MTDFLALIPAPVWAVIGVLGGAVIAGGVALFNGRRETLGKIVAALQTEVVRLSGRVESLEQGRDAYRSWSHVLWSHIHDGATPRVPAPTWPPDLPR
jgi:outer membrane murein-binding lipoprotein Lpp